MGWDADLDKALTGPSGPRQSSRAMQTTSPPLSQWSPSSSSSSSSSSSTFEPKPESLASISLSCVTRESSQECCYSRFVAWAAVKRNSHHLIRPSQKLQCPLVQCGQSFRDHEAMLVHLSKCEHLASREYWCYDHMRIERFDDMKCKRCISHPSRRRKMLTVAKTFFNTLGKKTKKVPDLMSDVEDLMLAPPSYHESEFLNLDLPEKPELSSTTEILEIDSTEVTASDPPVPAIDPQELLLPELDCLPVHSSMQWQPTPIVPNMSYDFSIAAPAYESLSAARPSSQISSTEPPHGQSTSRSAPPSARSKNLSPSSSVRSTSSTTSNVSAISTSSSLWSTPSTAWSGMETNFTSSMDLISPLDCAPSDFFDNVFENCPSGPLEVISELPADIPELHELPSGDFGMQDSLFAFDANLASANTSYPADLAMAEVAMGDEEHRSPAVQALNPGNQSKSQSETKSLAAAAWDALSEHILSSHAKIKHLRNPLAYQVGMLSPQTIAQKGLTSLRSILGGRPLTSPLDTLCVIHIIYSFSLAACGDGVTQRSNQLFKQSLLYSAWFTSEDQVQFREVATAIWQPSGMTDVQLEQLIKNQSSSLCQPFSDKGKGKGKVDSPGNKIASKVDPLISNAQNFLDELEMTAVLGSSFEIHASEIRARHEQNEIMRSRPEGISKINSSRLMNVLKVLVNQFHEVDGLIARLSEVNQCINNGILGSTRRFELEALQAGQLCIVTSKYHESYAPLVRSLCDPIYELDGNSGLLQRQDYYALGISLSEALIIDLQAEPLDSDAVSTIESDNDAPLEFLTSPIADDLMDLDFEVQPLPGLGGAGLDLQPGSTSEPSNPTADTTRAAANDLSRSPSNASSNKSSIQDSSSSSSSISPTQSEQEQQTPQQKLEADACCEICGYRPKGDPRWFHGSMAKHRKLQHSTGPPKIYKCNYPGCSSAFKNRPDNLRQHQIEKGHFVDGEGPPNKRPSKRKKVS